MTVEDLKKLEKEAAKLKFIAGNRADELHDLEEDRLEETPAVAEATCNACTAWKDKLDEVKAAALS